MVLDKPASGFTSAEVGSSLMSAQSLQPYKDFPHGSPPGYSDSDHRGLPTGLAIPVPVPSPLLYQVPEGHVASSRRTSQTCVVSVSPRLSSNPEALYELIVQQAKLPPQPHVTIKGTHMRTRWNGNQGTTKETVIDFDFRIEATSTALRMYDPDDGGGEETLNQPFRRLVVAQDRDGVKTYRGGRCKSKGKFKGKTNVGGDVEGYQSGAGTMLGLNEPTLREWCERFHRNRAAVKSFTLQRAIVNWDLNALQQHITALLRSTNYRGLITTSVYIHHDHLTIYSPSLVNRLRTNPFIWWICVLFQLWVITWPLIILLESRYAVVRAEWYVSHANPPDLSGSGPSSSAPPSHRRVYAHGRDELGWVDLFGPAIKSCALSRRKGGELITEVEAYRIMAAAEQESAADREGREWVNSGQVTWLDSLAGLVRGTRGKWEQLRGWGADC